MKPGNFLFKLVLVFLILLLVLLVLAYEHERAAADDDCRAGHDAYPQTNVALIAGLGC